jgi:hypothetical protein
MSFTVTKELVKEMLGAIKTAFYEFREEVRIERVKQRGE